MIDLGDVLPIDYEYFSTVKQEVDTERYKIKFYAYRYKFDIDGDNGLYFIHNTLKELYGDD